MTRLMDTERHAVENSKQLESTFAADDGQRLFYRVWTLADRDSRTAVLLHRGHEHSGRLGEVAQTLVSAGWNVFAPDLRGHGRSPGERGGGQSFAQLVRDLDFFMQHLGGHHGVEIHEIDLIAHSVGAVVAAAWVHDFGPPVRSLTLIAPAFRVRLYVPLAIPGLRLLKSIKPRSFVKSYVKPGMLTGDAGQARKYSADPMIFRQISVPMLLGLHDAGTRLMDSASAIRVPVMVLSAGTDWVVKSSAQRTFFDRLSTRSKQWRDYPRLRHDLLHESDRPKVFADIVQFVQGVEGSNHARPVAQENLEQSRVVDRLKKPLPIWSPRGWIWAATRGFLKTVGRLSAGINLGWREGFDAGNSLDHVYRNKATGWSPLGRLIDRVYLDSPGWKGIRERRQHLGMALDEAIGSLAARGAPVHLMDMASGPGRYILDAVKRHGPTIAHARLCDCRSSELERGRTLAMEMDLNNVIYESRDAFDAHAMLALNPVPTLAIVSGLYELFPDNTMVQRSLNGLASVMKPGGMLVYTNQPWHPQLEFIARVLRNREGVPWVMRCRSQAEMDGLAERAGFTKLRQWMGEDGIFTVSLAVRAEQP